MRNVLLIVCGQSNQQGSTLTDNGGTGTGVKFTSVYSGNTEPYLPNNNGAGSCWPLLEDLAAARGIKLIIKNCAIGGSSILHWTGIVGSTPTGSTSAPLTANNMSGSGLSGGTVPAVEGQSDFDPFGFCARARAQIVAYPQITDVISLWANAESDGGTSQANYQAALESISNYMLASNSKKHFIGLSSSGNNSQANMDKLQAARLGALSSLIGAGKSVAEGADLYVKFGMNAPLYPEKTQPATKVHLTAEGQRVHAALWDSSFLAGGY